MNNHDEGVENDLFAQALLNNGDNSRPVILTEEVLRSMRYEEVFIQDLTHLSKAVPIRYYKNMVPDVAIFMCENCGHFFLWDEYEFAYMENGYCPFCKYVEKDKE